MSFGFSIGDFIAVGKLAMGVYRSCRDAPESFSNISMEVLSLHAVLTEVQEIIAPTDMSPKRQNSLAVIMQGCEGVLKDLEALVLRYESLGTQSKRTWDRMKWGMNDIAELRSRLTSNTVLLTAFMSTCQVVVERKLNKLAQEFQEGKHEGSVITTVTVASITQDDKETWREIRKEFENIGISVAAFDANKSFIMEWFQSAMTSGAFMESCKPSKPDDLYSDAYSLHPSETSAEGDLGEEKSAPTEPMAREPAQVESNSPRVVTHNTNRETRILPTKTIIRTSDRPPKKAPRIVALVGWALNHNGAFRKAVEQGDFTEAFRYLSKGVNIDAEVFSENEKSTGTITGLQWAVTTRNKPAAAWLLQRGADPNYIPLRSTTRRYPISIALSPPNDDPHFPMAQLLLEYGANIDLMDGSQQSALHIACQNNEVSVAAWLLDRGAKTNLLDWQRETPLLTSIRRNNISLVRLLLRRGADVNRVTSSFMHAVNMFADVNTRNRVTSPFMYALDMGYDDIGLLCLQWGVNLDKTNYRAGNTPLHTAARGRCYKSLEVLLYRGLDAGAKNSLGQTPLNLASGAQTKSLLKLWLREGKRRPRTEEELQFLKDHGCNVDGIV